MDREQISGQSVSEAADLRDEVARLEAALNRAREASAQALVQFTDLEEQERLEHESRLLAESIVQTVREPLLVLDEELRVRTASRAFHETFRAPPEETEGRLLYELGNGQWNIPALRTLLESVLREDAQFQDFEVEQEFPDIGHRVMLLNARQIRWNGNQKPFVLLAIEDITVRKRAETELRRMLAVNEAMALASLQEREFADAIVSSMAEGVIVYGRRGEVISLNAAARKMLGLSDSEFGLSNAEVGTLLRVETPEGAPVPPEAMAGARALRGETVFGIKSVLHRQDGRKVWVSASAAPITPPSGEPWGAVVAYADITDLHELQEQRDDILRAVSHDLRNPLTAIHGQAQVLIRLLRKAGEGGHLVQSAESILTSARRMNVMIEDLTDALRLESGQLQLRKRSVNLSVLTAELLARTAGAMEVERVKLDIPEDLPEVEADPDRLERILTNLVSNALKYSPSESEVLVRAAKLDGELSVSVMDRGRGIDPEDLSHIFERFYKTRGARSSDGLGLGLSISRRLVEAHGGRILAESAIGAGTTFVFTLPLDG